MTSALQKYRDSLTPEQEQTLLENARAARDENIALREANAHNIKTEYLDEPHWAALASQAKLRMPHKNEPTSSSHIRKYLRKLGVDIEVFNDHYTSIKHFLANNPRWSAYATAGIVLELAQ